MNEAEKAAQKRARDAERAREDALLEKEIALQSAKNALARAKMGLDPIVLDLMKHAKEGVRLARIKSDQEAAILEKEAELGAAEEALRVMRAAPVEPPESRAAEPTEE